MARNHSNQWTKGKFHDMEDPPPSEAQLQLLSVLNYEGSQPDTRKEASDLIEELKVRAKKTERKATGKAHKKLLGPQFQPKTGNLPKHNW